MRTQAEIDFFCHPNQSWLQKYWKPKVGDWVWGTDYDVVKTRVGLKAEGKAWLVVAVTGEGRYVHVSAVHPTGSVSVASHKVLWLPTLSDLLGMIEEAGIVGLRIRWDSERKYGGVYECVITAFRAGEDRRKGIGTHGNSKTEAATKLLRRVINE